MSIHVDLQTAVSICGVKPGTIRKWVFDGRIIRHDDGYDVDELLQWIDTRNPEALYSRAGLKMSDRPATMSA